MHPDAIKRLCPEGRRLYEIWQRDLVSLKRLDRNTQYDTYKNVRNLVHKSHAAYQTHKHGFVVNTVQQKPPCAICEEATRHNSMLYSYSSFQKMTAPQALREVARRLEEKERQAIIVTVRSLGESWEMEVTYSP